MKIARAASGDVFTTRKGFRKATSVHAALTGLGGDIFIIDDPQKPDDAQSTTLRNGVNLWFSNTLRSRLDDKENGVIIVVMQRVHLNDLTGHLLDHGKDWTVLNLAAIAEEDERIAIGQGRFHVRRAGEALHPIYKSLQTLEQLRGELGSEIFTAQYQQAPVPSGGALIRRDWLRYYDVLPERSYKTKVIQSWDTAAKDGVQHDDFGLHHLAFGGSEALLPVERDARALRLSTASGCGGCTRATLSTDRDPHRDARPLALTQELREAGRFVVRAISVERDKVTRLWLQQAKFEAGLVHFPRWRPGLQRWRPSCSPSRKPSTMTRLTVSAKPLPSKPWGYDATLSWVC